MKQTALLEEHKKLGGRLIDFGGWELPVQYAGVMEEHLACRAAAGLFDVSHMGEIHVEGKDAENFLNYLVTQQVQKISVGQAQYTVMCHESGGIVDDLLIYKRSPVRFLAVVNASNDEKDFQHFKKVEKIFKDKNPGAQFEVTHESHRYSQIAIQGPKAVGILQKITSVDLSAIKTYWFAEGIVLDQIPALIARTGYTGEDGFELYVEWSQGPAVWRQLIEKGASEGIKPCGLGARDTLRLEMKYPLYGHELNDETHPLQVGLNWVTALSKPDFMGKAAIEAARTQGIRRALVGIEVLGRGIPRQGYAVIHPSSTKKVGVVTSGTQSPSLKKAIAIVDLDIEFAQVGTPLQVEIRGVPVAAQVVPTPFLNKKK